MVATIKLYKDELWSDISSVAYMIGRRVSNAENVEKAADIQSPQDETARYVVYRLMDKACSNLRRVCLRYITTGRLKDSNALNDPNQDIVFVLNMPDSWNPGITENLTDQMHDYILYYCVAGFLEKTFPEESTLYTEKALSTFQQIKPLLELRTRPVRRRPSWL